MLGPLLLNIEIFDLFFIDRSSDLANYTDDTSPYECAPYYDKLKENLELTYKIFNPYAKCCKVAKHTLKILQCKHGKISKVCLAILHYA